MHMIYWGRALKGSRGRSRIGQRKELSKAVLPLSQRLAQSGPVGSSAAGTTHIIVPTLGKEATFFCWLASSYRWTNWGVRTRLPGAMFQRRHQL